MRCTPGRLRILALLRSSGLHLSIGEACARLASAGEDIHPTTVYRTLETLTTVGLVHAVPGPGPMRFGFTGEPHHHTVCRRCGRVDALRADHLREAVCRIEELTGLRPDDSGSLLVYGRCAGCSAGA
ncbi:Fur family transcriptional regulator [Streptomyces sp. NPDC003832]